LADKQPNPDAIIPASDNLARFATGEHERKATEDGSHWKLASLSHIADSAIPKPRGTSNHVFPAKRNSPIAVNIATTRQQLLGKTTNYRSSQ